jgi:hypothetical protein
VVLLIVIFPAWYLGAGALIVWRRLGWRESIAAHYAILMKRAEVQVAPLASSFHYEVGAGASEALPALPAPIDVVKPMAEWMSWVDDQPHTLLGGKTRAGKTWLVTALLERRIDSGADIFILDPHSSDWMGLPTAGGSGGNERREALKVEDLGISGAMRENFSRIALDERTVQTMIDAERDRERKAALQAAFRAMDRPAAAQIGAQTWLLDRRGLQPGQASSSARVWAGWDFDGAAVCQAIWPKMMVTSRYQMGDILVTKITTPSPVQERVLHPLPPLP